MKKCFSFLLAILFALMLCACTSEGTAERDVNGANSENTQFSQNGPEDSLDTTAAEPALTVSVTMDSAFSIVLDGDWNILSVESGDEELQSFLTGLDLTEKTYDEGMGTLLRTAREQGYLSGEICFAVPCSEFSNGAMDTLFAPVRTYTHDSGEFIAMDWAVIPEEEPNFSADWLYGTQRIKGDDETVYMDRWESAALGTGIKMTVYNTYSKLPDPNIYRGGPVAIGNDLDAIRLKIAYFYENGDWIITRFEDGFQAGSVSHREGRYEAYEYEDRVQTGWAYKDPDGSYSFFEYENGTMVRSFGFWTDGTTHCQNVFTYYSNGNVATSEEAMSDESFTKRTYYEDGTSASYDGVMPDGNFVKETYYEDGTTATSESPGYSARFNPDGSYQYVCSLNNEYWFEAGKLVKAVVAGVAYTDEETLSGYAAGFGITQ